MPGELNPTTTGGHSATECDDHVERQLARLAALPAGWDSFGAPPIDPAVIESARRLLTRLPTGLAPPPDLVPLARGSLQLEWNDGPRSLELEFETPTSVRYLKWRPQAGIEEEDSLAVGDLSRVLALLRWFARGAA